MTCLQHEVPAFLLEPEPMEQFSLPTAPSEAVFSESKEKERDKVGGTRFANMDVGSATQVSIREYCSSLRTESYLSATTMSATDALAASVEPPSSVRAGLYKVAQVFITHSAAVFFTRNSELDLVDAQVQLCERVLFIVERIVKSKRKLSSDTWKQLLTALLHVTQGVLGKESVVGNAAGAQAVCDSILAKKLACSIFSGWYFSCRSSCEIVCWNHCAGFLQTLIFTWLHASLQVYLSQEMWDRLLAVLSSLTRWRELIDQWSVSGGEVYCVESTY